MAHLRRVRPRRMWASCGTATGTRRLAPRYAAGGMQQPNDKQNGPPQWAEANAKVTRWPREAVTKMVWFSGLM